MHACKTTTYGSFLSVVLFLKFVFPPLACEQYLICKLWVRALRGAAGPNVEHRKKSVQIKAGTCKNTDLQLQTSTFHPTNDAATDEDPVKDGDD